MSTLDNILQDAIGTGNLPYFPSSGLGSAFENETILITGASGSIGSELTKQLSSLPCKKLILLDFAESALYDLQQELISNASRNHEIVICDIRNPERLESIFSSYEPTIVLHAAAYKHVPLMEHNPYEAITTNVLGTYNTSVLSVKYGVKKYIFISSDKAVNPTSIMGATKRIAELFISYLSKFNAKNTQLTTVRFGNVLGTSGSVVPLFKKQLERGGPMTLTHQAVERYFMPLPQAARLILETTALSKNNEIFIFEMGTPIKIADLAKKMIQLYGLRYPEDIEIKIIGLRPGEKLKEDLFFQSETPQPTSHEKIKILKVPGSISEDIESSIIDLCHIYPNTSKQDILSKIKNLVPEYRIN